MNNQSTEFLFENAEISEFGPPSEPGVYAVCVKDTVKSPEKIVYIGSSGNIAKRVLNLQHWYRILLSKVPNKFIYLKFIVTLDYAVLEKRLIAVYKPLLNVQHKNPQIFAEWPKDL